METIIAFVLDNIFILVIAAGFLMSLLGKAGRRAPRMPDFGGGGRETAPTLPRQAPRPAPSPDSRPVRTAAPRRAEAASAPARHSAPVGEGAQGHEGTPGAEDAYGNVGERHSRPARLPVRPAAGDTRSEIGPEQLRQAVVWAEILGPPRARSPRGRR